VKYVLVVSCQASSLQHSGEAKLQFTNFIISLNNFDNMEQNFLVVFGGDEWKNAPESRGDHQSVGCSALKS
jgi:hypothetical protein